MHPLAQVAVGRFGQTARQFGHDDLFHQGPQLQQLRTEPLKVSSMRQITVQQRVNQLLSNHRDNTCGHLLHMTTNGCQLIEQGR